MKSLPDHVLQKIFEKINPLQAVKLRVVSKTLGDSIECRFKNMKIWQKLCSDYKIKPWIFKIVEKRFPQVTKNWNVPLSQKAWKKVFFSYKKWRMIQKFSYVHVKLQVIGNSFRNKIECIDVWANYIAIGTRNGKILFYKNHAGFQLLFEGQYHLQTIMRIKFWYTETENLIAVIQLYKLLGCAHLKYWDVKNLKRVSNPFKDQDVENYACNNHRLFIATTEMIYELKWNGGELIMGQSIQLISFLGNVSKKLKIIDMCADPKKLAVIVNNNENFANVFIFEVPSANRLLFSLLDHSLSINLWSPDEKVFCYIPLPGIAIFKTSSLMDVSLSYDSLEIIPRPIIDLIRGTSFIPQQEISSMFLHCDILFLGLKIGKIIQFFLESVKNLVSLDFRALPSRTIDVCHDPIIHLNIIKINGILYIFSGTKTKLYFIQFVHDIVTHRMF